MMGKYEDGYYLILPNGYIQFYRAASLVRAMNEKAFKVNKEKVNKFESFCKLCREDFMNMGCLRLHTPVGHHQEHLGTDFLYVPPLERARVSQMIGHGFLITFERLKSFGVLLNPGVTDEYTLITLEDLLGTEELVDLKVEGEQGETLQDIQGKFHFLFMALHPEFADMFIERKRSWRDLFV
jgi:hypothetical protein